eukprot:UN23057
MPDTVDCWCDECIGVTCANGGVCVDGANEYTCECSVGYGGNDCDTVTSYWSIDSEFEECGDCGLTKYREVHCRDSNGHQRWESLCDDVGDKPDTELVCEATDECDIGYTCSSYACKWGSYEEDVDWGYYDDEYDYEDGGDCTKCFEYCDADPNCGAVECALGDYEYCSWWALGVCNIEDSDAEYNTCRKNVMYAWSIESEFEECGTDCGLDSETKYRTVTCMGSDGNQADECNDADKPDTDLVCEATDDCVTYAWSIESEFEECGTDCGL